MYPLYTKYAEYYDVIYKNYLEKTVPKLIDFIVEVSRTDTRREIKKFLT